MKLKEPEIRKIITAYDEMADKLKEMLKEVEKEEVQEINGYDPNFLKFAAKQTKRRKKKK